MDVIHGYSRRRRLYIVGKCLTTVLIILLVVYVDYSIVKNYLTIQPDPEDKITDVGLNITGVGNNVGNNNLRFYVSNSA